MKNAREPRIAVIGAGMSGILWGIKLQEAGLHDFQIYEKNPQLGGTWYENTYPGLSCDVPSHLYRYSFEPNPEWSHTFSPGAEIRDYFERITNKYNVERFISFTGAKWNRVEHNVSNRIQHAIRRLCAINVEVSQNVLPTGTLVHFQDFGNLHKNSV